MQRKQVTQDETNFYWFESKKLNDVSDDTKMKKLRAIDVLDATLLEL
jgi:hypothetical protein